MIISFVSQITSFCEVVLTNVVDGLILKNYIQIWSNFLIGLFGLDTLIITIFSPLFGNSIAYNLLNVNQLLKKGDASIPPPHKCGGFLDADSMISREKCCYQLL